MERQIYHGNISPEDIARALVAHFHRGNFRVQKIGTNDHLAVQISTREGQTAGGQTATSIDIQKVEDGILVQVGQQTWLGVAASLGMTALTTLANPWNLLNRLDDIAQDIESLSLVDEIWKVINSTTKAANAGKQLSRRLRRISCPYCSTANPVGESNCVSCGAPLGDDQPETCVRCGFVVTHAERYCPNCGIRLSR